MKNVFIDIDVILDCFFDREPFAEHSTKVLSLCESKKVNGFISPVICSNLYYILRRTASQKKVILKLNELLQIVEVLTIDKNIIHSALNSSFNDFEEAIQSYTAEFSGIIDVIITRNVSDFKGSKISIMTPENFLKIVKI